jgi:hypothetical protein
MSIYSARKNAHKGALSLRDGNDLWPAPDTLSSPEESPAEAGHQAKIGLDEASDVVFKWSIRPGSAKSSLSEVPDAVGCGDRRIRN